MASDLITSGPHFHQKETPQGLHLEALTCPKAPRQAQCLAMLLTHAQTPESERTASLPRAGLGPSQSTLPAGPGEAAFWALEPHGLTSETYNVLPLEASCSPHSFIPQFLTMEHTPTFLSDIFLLSDPDSKVTSITASPSSCLHEQESKTPLQMPALPWLSPSTLSILRPKPLSVAI